MKMSSILAGVMIVLLQGCFHSNDTLKSSPFSVLVSPKDPIVVYAFDNYTETPEAGKRAANIAAGVLSASKYKVIAYAQTYIEKRSDKIRQAKKLRARYLLEGGVSEWRYKAGIDGEPAISVSLRLIDVNKNQTVWSGVASRNAWGTSSIGAEAQKLFSSLFK